MEWYQIKKKEKNKNDVQFRQNIIYDVCKTLIQFELPKSMVKNFTDSINIKEFGKGSDIQIEAFETFIKLITLLPKLLFEHFYFYIYKNILLYIIGIN